MEQIRKLGKYQLVKKLGEGATSTVYLGHDPFTRRDVALKIFKNETLNDANDGKKYWRQLLNEMSLVGRLSHPHLVSIYDAGVDDEHSFVVMEYVAGGTLEKHTAPDKLLPLTNVVEYMFKCCRALNYAQFNGVIHRDIKPANLLLTEGGDIKISDMGASVITDAAHTQISAVGTPMFMSPEQINNGLLTHQTDIYSLGIVMYYLLTGRPPFAASNMAGLFNQILNAEYRPVRALRPDVSEELEKIVHRAMHKEAGNRYATWAELGNDLALCERLELCDETGTVTGDARKFTTLRELELFKDFTDAEIWELLGIAEWVHHGANSTLIKEGEFGDDLYILTEGTVGVTKGNRLLNVLHKGDAFGEIAYMTGTRVPRATTVVANTDVKVMRIPSPLLAKASEGCQNKFNLVIMRVMAEKLRTVYGRFVQEGKEPGPA